MDSSQHLWNAELYQQKHAFVFHYGADVLQVLDPQPGERILDLGCGTGELTAQIAARGAHVLGVDASASMVEKARQSFPHLRFQQADARELGTEQPFDAVFSNATLHWIAEKEQPSVLMNVFAALKPGGRFVAEMGGQGNVQRILTAFSNALAAVGIGEPGSPNYFPSVGEYAGLLEMAGFSIAYMQYFDRDTPLADPETGISDWLAMFRGDALNALSVKDRHRVLSAVNDQLRSTNFHDGHWFADYKRLRFVAIKPSTVRYA